MAFENVALQRDDLWKGLKGWGLRNWQFLIRSKECWRDSGPRIEKGFPGISEVQERI